MELQALRAFFGWCAVINIGILLYWTVMILLAREWVYRMHTRWFPISRDAFHVAMYGFIGAMKMLVLVFNLVPYLALRIIG